MDMVRRKLLFVTIGTLRVKQCWAKQFSNIGQIAIRFNGLQFYPPIRPFLRFLSGSKMFRPLVVRLFRCSFGYSCCRGWELRSIMTRLDTFMIPVPFLTTRFAMATQLRNKTWKKIKSARSFGESACKQVTVSFLLAN